VPAPSRSLALLVALGLFPAPAVAVAPAAAPARIQESVRVIDRAWRRVGLTATVTDRQGRPVRGLAADDFSVTDGGRAVALAEFGPEEGRRDRPLSVAVLLDLSESMRGQVNRVEEAARALLQGLRPGDEVMVAKFNHQLTVLQPFTGAIVPGQGALRDVGRAGGGTALFRSIEGTLGKLRDRAGRKVILVVSDGADNSFAADQSVMQSLYLQELIRICFRTNTTVYGVQPGIVRGGEAFEDFVAQTGGRLVYTGERLDLLFARLGEEFLSQYYLAWDIDPKIAEGTLRRIQVATRRSDLRVAALRGFVTPRGLVGVRLRDLGDDDASVRADALWDLGFADDPRAIKALLAGLSDREAQVRWRAAEGLGRQRDLATLDALIDRLADADRRVRSAAAEAIAGFGVTAVTALSTGLSRPEVAAGAAALLGRIGDAEALAPLEGLAASDDPTLRLAAARAITDLGLLAGVAPLRRLFGDPDPGLRRAALRGVLALAGPAAPPILIAHLRTEDDPVVRAAVEAMLEPPPPAAAP
jgi:VWFA-related protein